MVKKKFKWQGEYIPSYIFLVKVDTGWGYDIDELNEEINFIFTMLFPYEDRNPIAVWDIKFI